MPEDCQAFTSTALRVVSSALGWSVSDGTTAVALLDNQSDADLLLGVATTYSARCFIGRGNTRASPDSYIVQYWK
jgi:hypothetical protein